MYVPLAVAILAAPIDGYYLSRSKGRYISKYPLLLSVLQNPFTEHVEPI